MKYKHHAILGGHTTRWESLSSESCMMHVFLHFLIFCQNYRPLTVYLAYYFLTISLIFLYQVLMTAKFPFKVGARVLRLLYDNFLLQDFSLQNFSRGLQVGKVCSQQQKHLLLLFVFLLECASSFMSECRHLKFKHRDLVKERSNTQEDTIGFYSGLHFPLL